MSEIPPNFFPKMSLIKDLLQVCGDKLGSFLDFTIENHDKNYADLNLRLIYNIKDSNTRILLKSLEPRLAHFLLLLQNKNFDPALQDTNEFDSNSFDVTLCNSSFTTSSFIFKPERTEERNYDNQFIFKPDLQSVVQDPVPNLKLAETPLKSEEESAHKIGINTDWLQVCHKQEISATTARTHKSLDLYTFSGYSAAYNKFAASQLIPKASITTTVELVTMIFRVVQGTESSLFKSEKGVFDMANFRVQNISVSGTRSYCKPIIKVANLMNKLRNFAASFRLYNLIQFRRSHRHGHEYIFTANPVQY